MAVAGPFAYMRRMTRSFDVAVIGLGAMGSAALHAVAKRGQTVIGFEQFELGHDKGSSHGESRAIRLSYFEHPSYVPLLHSAYAKWRELEVESGETLLTVTGILEAGHPGSAVVRGSLAASREHHIVHEILDAAEIAYRFPAFRLPDGWSGLFQPDGGFLRPERAIKTFVAEALKRGAEVRTGTKVLDIRSGPSSITMRTHGETIEVARVVVAAGPWIGELAPNLAPSLKLTRQVLGWFAPVEPELVKPDRFPVFVIETEGDACYGFPDFAGTGVKAASHREGRTLETADALGQDGGPADEAQIRRVIGRFIPAADGPLLKLRTCIYTRTADEFFVLDHAPADPRIVLASPCSGHGFKFASVIGEILADLALDGRTEHDIGRFRIDRLASKRTLG